MAIDLLSRLGLRNPIFLAPMGGGPGTPQLAAAVANAGGLGALAAAYLTPAQIAAEIDRTRALTNGPLNVNLFAGGYHREVDRDPQPMLDLMREVHRELELPAPQLPVVPPDPFDAQLEVLLRAKPAVFSFTFGIPSNDALRAVRDAGIVSIGTATTLHEAQMLADAGVDAIAAQGAEAGAHRGTFAHPHDEAMVPMRDLVRQVVERLAIPVIASGGIMTGGDIASALAAGGVAVQMGTAFLACPEAGTVASYREALSRSTGDDTTITRAFSGRAARGIRNRFIERVANHEDAILPFPIQNTLTRPMRGVGNAEYLSLWAGTGVGRIRAMPAADLVATLLAEMEFPPREAPPCSL